MKQYRLFLLLLLVLTGVASCSPGHSGSTIITFLRDGHLWTIDPDGANALAIVSDATPVVGYSWSPTHQILAYRALDADFAKTSASKHLTPDAVTGIVGDLPTSVNTIGIDGGSSIPTMLSSPAILYGNPMWNSSGTRLLFRQDAQSATPGPNNALWWVAQNDQPAGIAAKTLPTSYSIPSMSPTNTIIGYAKDGIFTTTIAGSNVHFLAQSSLSGHPLPATLERILWQPAHQQPALLYAIDTAPQGASNTSLLTVQLVLRANNGTTTTLATCKCTQFSWSPDGNSVLYSAGSAYTVLHLASHTSFTISGEQTSVPYWSPDSQFLLLDGLHSLLLVRTDNGQQKTLLSDASTNSSSASNSSSLSDTNTLLQPVANSIWAADSRHFLFLTRKRVQWQGQALHTGKGLYAVGIDARGVPQGTPTLVDNGNDIQAGWSYEDPNTSFLYE